jgi:hypothetical protein
MTLTVVAGVDPSVPAPQDDRSIRAHSLASEFNSLSVFAPLKNQRSTLQRIRPATRQFLPGERTPRNS